jgi:hypothetical protein
MPSYLDFDSTKGFRNSILSRTLTQPDGPQSFNSNSYTYQNLSDSANIDGGDVDDDRKRDLDQNLYLNNYIKSLPLNLVENIDTIVQRSELKLYVNSYGTPVFNTDKKSLIGILTTSNYENESALLKFAASNIRDNPQGPFYARVQQNLEAATIGRFRLIDALNGNVATATNIITGKEPLIESNYKITVAKTLPGKVVDFFQTLTGVEFPFTEIPGDYLTNPLNPIQYRPEASTTGGRIFQDLTGTIGSLIGIQRRPKPTRKPSDLFIEYMGSGQKQLLYSMLGLSTYAPNYTTTARSQQSSKVFTYVDNFAQGVKTLLGEEAPKGVTYIGDDRSNDVKLAMSDTQGMYVRGNYYLSLLFDPIQTELLQRSKNYSEGGQISGKLTWISQTRINELGVNNENYGSQSSELQDSLSTKYGFREDSLLGYTQAMLNNMPQDAGQARSHIANVIDQTSRVFREGDVFLARGSAIISPKLFKNQNGDITGEEYCRTWTKDRPYLTYSDTMKKGMNIRKFEASVMSNPWNLNIAPMSNGKKDFIGSTNIFDGYRYGSDADGKSFYAKKYMFSIENLAWRTSNQPGFTVLDLPYCERGPNGGRVMWFPPYDLKISESNAARWEENTFLGRPEPIYTYQHTTRSGQLSFKVVVDHPSILNLLTREYFEGMSDEEADNFINAYFAGCEELDLYELIRRFPTIEKSDAELIIQYLNDGKTTIDEILKYRVVVETPEKENGGNVEKTISIPTEKKPTTESFAGRLNFENDYPKGKSQTATGDEYTKLYDTYSNQVNRYKDLLNTNLTNLLNSNTNSSLLDKKKYFGTTKPSGTTINIVNDQKTKIEDYFTILNLTVSKYTSFTENLVSNLSGKTVQKIVLNVDSSTSAISSIEYNKKLSLRRSHSVIKDFFTKITKPGTTPPEIKWTTPEEVEGKSDRIVEIPETKYDLKSFGWDIEGGEVIVTSKNIGELSSGNTTNSLDTNCVNKDFIFYKNIDNDLNTAAPISFYCRASEVKINYDVTPQPDPPKEELIITPPQLVPKTRLEIDGKIQIPRSVPPKPKIDVLKRIITKTLSECYYFQILNDKSPLVFKSLKEKLKYFHPGFHSTTPEGLNSRLTFLHQCLRPGDTIPIKGISDTSNIDARNTTFGPPPICILRIGDFYHSKVIIRDVNFTFEENVWDLNPEGIGVQPMIANVSCQISFIGGQGLEKPIERLQNALSSNFFANTEMYDERSESTNSVIAGQDAKEFTTQRLKEILEDFQNANPPTPEPDETSKGNEITEEKYIGNTIYVTDPPQNSYTDLIENVYKDTKNYFNSYEGLYNSLTNLYGSKIVPLFLSQNYRTIKDYDVYTTSGTTPNETIEIFGLYPKGKESSLLVRGLRVGMETELENAKNGIYLSTIVGFNKILDARKTIKSEDILYKQFSRIIKEKIDSISENQLISGFEKENRDILLQSLDKLNFLVKYGKDGSIKGETGTEAILSGFTSATFYDEYKNCISNISKNTTKMYEDMDTSIDYTNPTINTLNFTDIMKYFCKDQVSKIMDDFKKETIIFDTKTIDKLTSKLNDFVDVTESNKNFKFKDVGNRKNNKEISFSISSQSTITDDLMKTELKQLNSSINKVTDKLNYYKI